MSILSKLFDTPYKTRLEKARTQGAVLLREIEEVLQLDSLGATNAFLSTFFFRQWRYREERKKRDYFEKATKPKLRRINKTLKGIRELLATPRLEALFEGRKNITVLAGLDKDIQVSEPDEVGIKLENLSQAAKNCLRLIDREIHSLYSRV